MHIAYSNAYLTHILHIMQICVDFYIVKWYNFEVTNRIIYENYL